MKLQDYVILAVIAVWFVLALRGIARKKGGCGCGCAGSSSGSAGCPGCGGAGESCGCCSENKNA